jgi:hypothetical protein
MPQHLAAGAVFAVVTLALFFPVLAGDTFSDVSRRQQQVYPWAGLADPKQTGVPLHFDQADSFHPWQVFVSRSLERGEFPLWNPYSFGGAPFFSNGQNGLLYPPHIALSLTVSPTRTHDVLLASHFFFAGVAMFLLLGAVCLSFPAALVGGLAWMLNSFGLSWQALEHYTAIEVWLPAGMLAAHIAVTRRSWSAALALALVLATLFTGGNVLFVELAVVAISAYAVALAIAEALRDRHSFRGSLARLTTAAALFGGLVAILALPTLALSAVSARTSVAYGSLGEFALEWRDLVHLLKLPPDAAIDPYHRNLFAGTAIALLAVMGLLRPNLLARVVAGIGVLTVLFMLHTPVTFLVYHVLPGFENFKPLARAAFLVVFALAVLAAFGLDSILERLRAPKDTRSRPLVLGLVLGVVLAGSTFALTHSRLGIGPALALAALWPPAVVLVFEAVFRGSLRRALRSPLTVGVDLGSLAAVVAAHLELVELASAPAYIAATVIVAAATAALVAVSLAGRSSDSFSSRARLASTAIGTAFAVTVGGATFIQAQAWASAVMTWQPDRPRYLYPATPLIRELERRPAARILPTGMSFRGSTVMVHDLRSASGYESILPLRTQNLWRVVGEGLSPESFPDTPLVFAYHPEFALPMLRPWLLERVGVAYVVTPGFDRARSWYRLPDGRVVDRRRGYYNPDNPYDTGRPAERNSELALVYGPFDPAWEGNPQALKRTQGPAPQGLAHVYEGRDGRLFAVAGDVLWAAVVRGCEAVETPLAALERFVSQAFDASGSVILERGDLGRAASSCSGTKPGGAGTATLRKRSLNSMLVDVRARSPAWLVVTETWDEGWTATIDGREADVLPANYAFRAVRVPAGAHSVRFSYEPESFRFGVAVSSVSLGATLCGLAAAVWLRRLRRRKDRARSELAPATSSRGDTSVRSR